MSRHQVRQSRRLSDHRLSHPCCRTWISLWWAMNIAQALDPHAHDSGSGGGHGCHHGRRHHGDKVGHTPVEPPRRSWTIASTTSELLLARRCHSLSQPHRARPWTCLRGACNVRRDGWLHRCATGRRVLVRAWRPRPHPSTLGPERHESPAEIRIRRPTFGEAAFGCVTMNSRGDIRNSPPGVPRRIPCPRPPPAAPAALPRPPSTSRWRQTRHPPAPRPSY